jgi:hypothetical protein
MLCKELPNGWRYASAGHGWECQPMKRNKLLAWTRFFGGAHRQIRCIIPAIAGTHCWAALIVYIDTTLFAHLDEWLF